MTNTTMTFLGNTDEVGTCDCCGRTGLKSTVALESCDGSVVHYGVVCAARALSMATKEVRAAARKADDARRARENAARDAEHRAWMARWVAFLAERAGLIVDWSGRPDLIKMADRLGGMTAAREAFESAGSR